MFPGLHQIAVPMLIVVSGFLCLEFAFPVAIGEFLAGIIGSQFIDTKDIPWLKFFSYIGLLGIMFLAGFEIDMPVLKRNLKKSLAIGLSSFFIPYTIVTLVALAMDISLIKALLLATAMSTTSLAMVFTILRDANITNTEHGQILLGSAMIVDLASMLSLTLIFLEFNLANLLYLAVLIMVLIFARKLIVAIFKRYKGNRFEFELKFFLLVLLGIGVVSREAGVHGAIIAFLIGMIFSDIEKEHELIIVKLETVVFSLLAPIFFFHAGSLIAFRELTAPTLMMFGVFLVLAVAGKFFGTFISLFYLYHKDTAVARYGGIIFNYRLSFGIVTGIYAFNEGLIDLQLLNIILLIVAVSSIIAVYLEKKLAKEICLIKAPSKKSTE